MRIIETDFEWNKFLKELYERKIKKIEEVEKILDSLFVSLEGESIDHCKEIYCTLLEKTKKPESRKKILCCRFTIIYARGKSCESYSC